MHFNSQALKGIQKFHSRFSRNFQFLIFQCHSMPTFLPIGILPHVYHILFFMTNAWKAAFRMQIVEEVSYWLFFYIITSTRLKHYQNECMQFNRTIEALTSDFSYQSSRQMASVVQHLIHILVPFKRKNKRGDNKSIAKQCNNNFAPLSVKMTHFFHYFHAEKVLISIHVL